MSYHSNIHLVGTVTVGPKGQVVIPIEVRDAMGIRSGDKLVALYFDDKKSLGLITEEQAQEFVTKMGEKYTDLKRKLGK